MATNLQVGAQTSQAVGAFNALHASILQTQGAFNNLASTVSQNNAIFSRHAGSILSLNTAFDRLMSVARSVLTVFTAVAGALELVFSSMLKELNKLQGFNAIMSVTSKNSEDTAASFNFLRATADKLGVPFDALAVNFAKLYASIPDGVHKLQTTENAFLGVAMAARTLHASAQDTQLMFYAVTQIASKGVVSMEELRRQLGEKLPGILQIAARALNTTPDILEAAIRKGAVNSAKFLQFLGDELIRTFTNSSAIASSSVDASLLRLRNVWIDFVKAIIDSGASQAIANVFDVLREKLSDQYLITRFAELVKDLADRFAGFIKNLTADDIRNGFDTFGRGLDMMVNVLGKVISLMTWMINNSGKVGAVLGAMGGASVGLLTAGPYGALAGAVVGGIGGAIAGRSVAPTEDQKLDRVNADNKARTAVEAANMEQSKVVTQMMIPMLKSFKLEPKDAMGLFTPEMATKNTVEQMASVFTDSRFKTFSQQQQAIRDYSKYARVVGPRGTMTDVIQAGKVKPDPNERRIDRAFEKATGFDSGFKQEWEDYNTLFKRGKLTTEQLEQAQAKLLAKQPFMEAMAKSEKRDKVAENAELEKLIKNLEFEDKLRQQRAHDMDLANMLPEDAKIESQVYRDIESYNARQMVFDEKHQQAAREYYRTLEDTLRVQSMMAQLLAVGPDRNQPFVDQLKATQRLTNNPKSGYTNQDARIAFGTTEKELFSTTSVGIETVLRAYQDMYSKIVPLQRDQIITEREAAEMRVASVERYRQAVIAAEVAIAQARLDSGIGDWADMTAVAIGRLLQGFTTLQSAAATAMANVVVSLVDGFADAIGRTVAFGENFKQNMVNVLRQTAADLMAAFVKMLIQNAVKSVFGDILGKIGGIAGGGGNSPAAAAAAATSVAMTELNFVGVQPLMGAMVELTASAYAAAGSLGATAGSSSGLGSLFGMFGGNGSYGSSGLSGVSPDFAGVAGLARGGVAGPYGLSHFARGGVAGPQGLTHFAKGGTFTNQVFHEPTFFKFAKGNRFGVMGEAGPEAVMPLKRGPNGMLGVSMFAGGGEFGTSNVRVNHDVNLNVSSGLDNILQMFRDGMVFEHRHINEYAKGEAFTDEVIHRYAKGEVFTDKIRHISEYAKGEAFTDQPNAVRKYVKGNAFTDPLHYVHEFAKGHNFGLMGEAGPEAVMPLKRGPDGSLGVSNYDSPTRNDPNLSGVAIQNVTHFVVENNAPGVAVEQRESTRSDGSKELRAIVKAVKSDIAGDIRNKRGDVYGSLKGNGLPSGAGLPRRG